MCVLVIGVCVVAFGIKMRQVVTICLTGVLSCDGYELKGWATILARVHVLTWAYTSMYFTGLPLWLVMHT